MSGKPCTSRCDTVHDALEDQSVGLSKRIAVVLLQGGEGFKERLQALYDEREAMYQQVRTCIKSQQFTHELADMQLIMLCL